MINYINKLGFKNYKPTEVQDRLPKVNKLNKNILIVSSCGSGKTEAGYNWLLNKNEKSLFVQPMRTLATSIYHRLNNYNKILELENWTIQHSSISNDKFLNNKYCVTTIDQILTGWMGLGKQSFIRGKNVITSNIVFDEVQLFEPNKTFLTTINMLDSIYKENNQNFIIMTATMPTYLIDFLKERYDMEVIICENESIENRYVTINYIDNLNFNNINNCNEKQIIICNSQGQQKYILENIEDQKRCIILNNSLLNTDRENVEKEVYTYFDKNSKGNNKILITTQIVEAGIDISANIVYSVLSPIDNLIQRAGRCSRWGGYGTFNVFYLKNYIYDDEVIIDTLNKIKDSSGVIFTWNIQKQWINEILNPYYQKYINNENIRKNKIKLINNKRSELIRDIRNINIIVQDIKYGLNIDMFKKESVSIDIERLKNLTNEFYILEKGIIKQIKYYEIDIGDTIVMSNEHCIYDKLGFRFEENSFCDSFIYKNKQNENNIIYEDYIKEPWISHSLLTKKILYEKLIKNKNNTYINKNIDIISSIGGLHDLGKLDIEWVKWTGIKENEEPLAHFPFTKKVFRHKNRKHNYISAYILKEHIDFVLFNALIQHHGRVICIKDNLYIDKYKLHKNTKKLINTYGFKDEISNISGEEIVIKGNEIINPSSEDWNTFLLIVGLLMESDIEAINTYKNLNNKILHRAC